MTAPWISKEQLVDHLVSLAQRPGWWDYVEHQAKHLDATASETTPPLYAGIEQAVAQRLQQLGFKRPRRRYPPYGSQGPL